MTVSPTIMNRAEKLARWTTADGFAVGALEKGSTAVAPEPHRTWVQKLFGLGPKPVDRIALIDGAIFDARMAVAQLIDMPGRNPKWYTGTQDLIAASGNRLINALRTESADRLPYRDVDTFKRELNDLARSTSFHRRDLSQGDIVRQATEISDSVFAQLSQTMVGATTAETRRGDQALAAAQKVVHELTA